MNSIECFKIRLWSSPLDVFFDLNNKESKEILTISYDKDSKRNPIIIVADPFLFIHQNELYLFYEEKHLYTPGVIRMMKTTDLKDWSKPVTVLQETFHLSYPYVFEHEGDVFMIPETCNVGEVRLYKADNEKLTNFSQNCVLLEHSQKDNHITIDYSDSSVFIKDGKYFLMTTLEIDGNNSLFLYVADRLRGPYKEHPFSPICKSNKYGRNAGSLIQNYGKLFRVAQDCEKRYGDNVHIFEITEMSKSSYKEVIVCNDIFDSSIPFYKHGGHQFNMVEFNGKQIIATDAKGYHYFFKTRVKNKLSLFK